MKEYTVLKSIINEVDPLGLMDLSIPQSLDEYEPELNEIFKKDITSLNRKKLSNWILKVFILYFNEEIVNDKKKFDLIAKKFLDAMNNQ